MAKVYSHPDEIKVPEHNWADDSVLDMQKKDAAFLAELKAWCQKRNPNQEHVGEVLYFPMGDGYAQYMVAAISPVQLIHIPLGDAWSFQYANKLTKKDVVDQIKQQKAIEKLFPKRK